MIITSAKIKPQDLSQKLKNLSVFFVLNEQKLENKNETCESLMGEYLAKSPKILSKYYNTIENVRFLKPKEESSSTINKLTKEIQSENSKTSPGMRFIQANKISKTKNWFCDFFTSTCSVFKKYNVISYLRGLTSEVFGGLALKYEASWLFWSYIPIISVLHLMRFAIIFQ